MFLEPFVNVEDSVACLSLWISFAIIAIDLAHLFWHATAMLLHDEDFAHLGLADCLRNRVAVFELKGLGCIVFLQTRVAC